MYLFRCKTAELGSIVKRQPHLLLYISRRVFCGCLATSLCCSCGHDSGFLISKEAEEYSVLGRRGRTRTKLPGLGFRNCNEKKIGKKFNKFDSMQAARTMSKQREVSISKALSYLLRHDRNTKMDGEGWANIDEVLKMRSMTKLSVTKADIRFVIQNNEKQRYALKQVGNMWFVRANQGHTLTVRLRVNDLLTLRL